MKGFWKIFIPIVLALFLFAKFYYHWGDKTTIEANEKIMQQMNTDLDDYADEYIDIADVTAKNDSLENRIFDLEFANDTLLQRIASDSLLLIECSTDSTEMVFELPGKITLPDSTTTPIAPFYFLGRIVRDSMKHEAFKNWVSKNPNSIKSIHEIDKESTGIWHEGAMFTDVVASGDALDELNSGEGAAGYPEAFIKNLKAAAKEQLVTIELYKHIVSENTSISYENHANEIEEILKGLGYTGTTLNTVTNRIMSVYNLDTNYGAGGLTNFTEYWTNIPSKL